MGPTAAGLKWRLDTGVVSELAIGRDGTVYYGDGLSRPETGFRYRLYAVAPDGAQKWHRNLVGGAPAGIALGGDGTIYQGAGPLFLALTPTGRVKWRLDVGSTITSPPTIAQDGTIYFGTMSGTLYALTSRGGRKWSFDADAPIKFAPAIAQEGIVYFGTYDARRSRERLYAVTADGTLRWTRKIPSTVLAVGDDGTLYFGTQTRGDASFVTALHPEGAVRWRFRIKGSSRGLALGKGGTIYVGSNADRLYALKPEGTLKWVYSVAYGFVTSPPSVAADGTIYFGTSQGGLRAVTPEGTLKWRFPANAWIVRQPAIGPDRTVYFSSDYGEFYAVGEK